MPRKNPKPDQAKPAKNRNAVELVALPSETPARTVARCLLDPATTAAGTLNRLYRAVSQEGDINGYIAELQHQAEAANAGNLSRPEAMLTTQAQSLDGLFHSLTNWALNHVKEGGDPAYFDTWMRLALKPQSQSRATVETLAAIKNPPVVYARQANFAAGHQQVNNGIQPSGARETKSPPTKLLDAQHGERLDTGTTSAASAANQELAAVGAINGTSHGRG
jgi:hypothetical protein